jgi:hypothetical protein
MPCYLLHMIESPNTRPYDDTDVKDLVGQYPRLFCAQCTPPEELSPSSSVRCLQRDAPCWRQTPSAAPPAPEPPAASPDDPSAG